MSNRSVRQVRLSTTVIVLMIVGVACSSIFITNHDLATSSLLAAVAIGAGVLVLTALLILAVPGLPPRGSSESPTRAIDPNPVPNAEGSDEPGDVGPAESAGPTEVVGIDAESSSRPTWLDDYLEVYPEHNRPSDLAAGFVRTSAESFFLAARLMAREIPPGNSVWSTDNIRRSSKSSDTRLDEYWFKEGLKYLEIDFELVKRGVQVSRIFLLPRKDRRRLLESLSRIAILQAKCGISCYLAIVEDLPVPCRIDFAVFGDRYVDEVKYDIQGQSIIDNYIHWPPSKATEFAEKMGTIRNYARPIEIESVGVAATFDEIARWARSTQDDPDDRLRLSLRAP